MVIDNIRKVVIARLRGLFLAFLFMVSIILVVMFMTEPIFGITNYHIAIGLGLIYIVLNIYYYVIDVNYVYFNDEGEKLLLRYYSRRPFSDAKKSIEIPKHDLVSFEIKESLFGLKKSLILHQKINNRAAKYPPICLTGLNKKQLSDLINSLSFILKLKSRGGR